MGESVGTFAAHEATRLTVLLTAVHTCDWYLAGDCSVQTL